MKQFHKGDGEPATLEQKKRNLPYQYKPECKKEAKGGRKKAAQT